MFKPKQVIFEKGTKDYEIGRKLYEEFIKNPQVEVYDEVALNKIKSYIPGESPESFYQNGKKTLVVSKKKPSTFQTCKPSADYMLPLVSGCMGQCEYCYLHTQLGDKPFVRVNVNLEDIFDRATKYMEENAKNAAAEGKIRITTFEGSATSDPLCVEPYTGALKKTIEFFATEPKGAFRFVSKYSDVDNLLNLNHNNKTEIRFSLNTERVRSEYEHFTASISARIQAAKKVMEAGYPVGFLIAPVFLYEGWESEYEQLLIELKDTLPKDRQHPLFFEVITHRYTTRAKNLIEEIFPTSTLPMKEEERQYKHGQFGYGKYVYPKDRMQAVKQFFGEQLPAYFPDSETKYIV